MTNQPTTDQILARLDAQGDELSKAAAAELRRWRDLCARARRERDEFADNPIFED